MLSESQKNVASILSKYHGIYAYVARFGNEVSVLASTVNKNSPGYYDGTTENSQTGGARADIDRPQSTRPI